MEIPENFDPTRRSGRVRLHNVAVTEDDILPGVRASALARARTLLAAEAVGGATECVESAVDYAKVRKQFGQLIGQFQAVQHKLANGLTSLDGARLTLEAAAQARDDGNPNWRVFAASALAFAGPAGARSMAFWKWRRASSLSPIRSRTVPAALCPGSESGLAFRTVR